MQGQSDGVRLFRQLRGLRQELKKLKKMDRGGLK